MKDWSNKEKHNYINTYTKPDSSNLLKVTDFEKEVYLKKEMKNNIYKEAFLLTMTIINKYFNIEILDGELMKIIKQFYDCYRFCIVPLYIAPNKELSDRLLNAYKKLTKIIWPSITLIKHNDPSFSNQEIDLYDDDNRDYDSTVDFYHSRKIIKTGKQNNAIEITTIQKFNLTVIDLDDIYL